MEVGKKRAVEGAKTGSPKKQRVSKKSATGKGKKAPDSNKPKRPMSAYFFFLESFRKELQQKKLNGEDTPTKIGDVAKSAGEQWRKMTEEEKKPFSDSHTEAKKAYDNQIKSIKPVRDENKPKKPRTAFFFFLEEFREEKKDDGEQGKKIPSLAGEKWRSMDDGNKKKYTDMAAEAKKEFDVQMKEYLAKNPKKPIEKAPKKAKVQVKEDSESEEEEDEDEEEDNDDGDDDGDEEESD